MIGIIWHGYAAIITGCLIGLFSIKAVKLQRDYWQAARGKRTNAYMKDAGRKAALTRAEKGIGREMALKAGATRRAHSRAASQVAAANDEGQQN